MAVLSPAFRKNKEGQRALLTSVAFQCAFTQNNPYATVAYFATLHYPPKPYLKRRVSCLFIELLIENDPLCFSIVFICCPNFE